MTKQSKRLVTRRRLKELLHYDPETGMFTALEDSGCSIKFGERVGRVTTLGYRVVFIDGTDYLEHRLAQFYVGGRWPKEHTDHLNGVRHDNRFENIRPCSNAENRQNQGLYKTNKSGAAGVHWDSGRNKWKAQVKIGGRTSHLGSFRTLTEAVAARVRGKAALHPFHPVDPSRKSYDSYGGVV